MTTHNPSTGAATASYFYLKDARGNVVAMATPAGGVVERYIYDAYGTPTVYNTAWGSLTSQSPLGNPYLFQSRNYDSESGLYYYRLRYMDPFVGRFITPDPIGNWGDTANLGNPYTYVGNNPWTKSDPMGLWGIQFGDNGPNWGSGDPTLVLGSDASDGVGDGISVLLDTLLRGTPYRDAGYYSNGDPGIWWSQKAAIGGLGAGGLALGGWALAPGVYGLPAGQALGAIGSSLAADATALGAGVAGAGTAAWQRLAGTGPQACTVASETTRRSAGRAIARAGLDKVDLPGVLRGIHPNLNPSSVGDFFGWGNKVLNYPLSHFSRDMLLSNGYSRDALQRIADAYWKIWQTTPQNESAYLRWKQMEELINKYFR